jgi:hypothetical protein
MKYRPKLKIFSNSNKSLRFYPDTGEAMYHGRLVSRMIRGVLVLNSYNYGGCMSHSGDEYYYTLSRLFRKLELKYIVVDVRNLYSLKASLNDYLSQIQTLIKEINNPRTRKQTNERRAMRIKSHLEQVRLIRWLLKEKNWNR